MSPQTWRHLWDIVTRGQVQTWLAPTIQNALTAESSWSGNTSPSSGIYHPWSELTKVQQTFWQKSQEAIVDNQLRKNRRKTFAQPWIRLGQCKYFLLLKLAFLLATGLSTKLRLAIDILRSTRREVIDDHFSIRTFIETFCICWTPHLRGIHTYLDGYLSWFVGI